MSLQRVCWNSPTTGCTPFTLACHFWLMNLDMGTALSRFRKPICFYWNVNSKHSAAVPWQHSEGIAWNFRLISEYACLLFGWQAQLQIKVETLVGKLVWRVFSIRKKHVLFMKRQWCKKCFGTLEATWNDETRMMIVQGLTASSSTGYFNSILKVK